MSSTRTCRTLRNAATTEALTADPATDEVFSRARLAVHPDQDDVVHRLRGRRTIQPQRPGGARDTGDVGGHPLPDGVGRGRTLDGGPLPTHVLAGQPQLDLGRRPEVAPPAL